MRRGSILLESSTLQELLSFWQNKRIQHLIKPDPLWLFRCQHNLDRPHNWHKQHTILLLFANYYMLGNLPLVFCAPNIRVLNVRKFLDVKDRSIKKLSNATLEYNLTVVTDVVLLCFMKKCELAFLGSPEWWSTESLSMPLLSSGTLFVHARSRNWPLSPSFWKLRASFDQFCFSMSYIVEVFNQAEESGVFRRGRFVSRPKVPANDW